MTKYYYYIWETTSSRINLTLFWFSANFHLGPQVRAQVFSMTPTNFETYSKDMISCMSEREAQRLAQVDRDNWMKEQERITE